VVQGALAVQMYPKARRATETGGSARPLTVKLTGFAEARVIGERYRDGSSVILDMTGLSDSDARRVVDFAAGLAFALHGSIDKVTARVFMLLPPHVDMSAEDRRAFAAGGWG
jgi:cell division inhibitor SepF